MLSQKFHESNILPNMYRIDFTKSFCGERKLIAVHIEKYFGHKTGITCSILASIVTIFLSVVLILTSIELI